MVPVEKEPLVITEETLQVVVAKVASTDWMRARREGATRDAITFVQSYGPLFADFHADRPTRRIEPAPPGAISLDDLLADLGDLRLGIGLLGILRESSRQKPRVVEFREDARARVEEIADYGWWLERGFGPGESTTTALVAEWIAYKATGRPWFCAPYRRPGDRPAPMAVDLGGLLWLIVGHQSGAFTLPFPRALVGVIEWCAQCGDPVFKKRSRGQLLFCNPEPGEARSRCYRAFYKRPRKRGATDGPEF